MGLQNWVLSSFGASLLDLSRTGLGGSSRARRLDLMLRAFGRLAE
uniref:Uncharacterized protein n=1 Tax=Rhizophora mucronata TaxID=61149 RepID=A0A2P2QFG7_RHIMU